MNKILFFFLLSASVSANVLDNPLTLGKALEIARIEGLAEIKTKLDIELLNIELNNKKNVFNAKYSLEARTGQRESYLLREDDNQGFLHINKLFYDEEANVEINSKKILLTSQKTYLKKIFIERKINVMRTFFDTLSADLEYYYRDEALAMAAVRSNRAEDYIPYGTSSDVEVLKNSSKMLEEFNLRLQVESKQRLHRAKLAELLNSRDNLPDKLIRPDLSTYWDREVISFEKIKENVLTNNLDLNIMYASLKSLKEELQNKKKDYQVKIDGDIRLGEQSYSREKEGQWRFGVNLSVPLYDGGDKEYEIKKLELEIKSKEIEIEEFKAQLNIDVLTLWLSLNELKNNKIALQKKLEYKDLYLEKARANYEMNIKSDLGDAMTELTKSEWLYAKNEFDFVITWEKLNLLAGGKLYEI